MNKKKNTKRIISLICIAVVVALLAAMPLIAGEEAASDGPTASILTGTAALGSIDNELIGGGTLAEEDAMTIQLPAAVKLKEFLVSNGDFVTEGTAIATVDRVTVMTAISQVQETLEYLSLQIEAAGDTDEEETVSALAGGTVKILYAKKGDAVQDVMLEHGALTVLSLDGLMAVDLETESGLSVGTAVTVTFSDGTAVQGKIAKNLVGEMTVTLEDDGYAPEDQVQISAQDGTVIGSGALYIYNPWNATAYAGTVSSVHVKEGDTLDARDKLMVLTDMGYSASYRQLISQRQKYEDLMLDLFSMYQTETVTAPCDSVVSGVDKEGAYMLSAGGSWKVSLLSFLGSRQHNGYIAYPAQVTEVTHDGMTLKMAAAKTDVTDLTRLSAIPADTAAMQTLWDYKGDTAVYTQKENGLLEKAGSAKVGDTLLVVGDEESVRWFVALDAYAPEQKETAFVTLLSNEDPPAEGEEPPAGGEEPPAGGEEPPAGGEEPPTEDPTVTYLGYVAQVTEVSEGVMKVMQTPYSYTVTDLNDLPMVTVDTDDLTKEVTYTSPLITETAVSVNDCLLVIVEQDGTLKHFVKQQLPAGGGPSGDMPGGMGGSFGGGSFGGMTMPEAESTFELYGLDMNEVAAVTPQGTMVLEITVDELDIRGLQPGMTAQVKIGALGGEKHTATVTQIGNTGTNNGGSSKYTVELTMERTGNMLAGMNATATIVLSTAADILTVPAAALVEQGNRTVVYTGYDEETETLLDPVEVTVGHSDGKTAQITEGLAEGQTYYYAYYDTLEISNAPDFGGGGFMFG